MAQNIVPLLIGFCGHTEFLRCLIYLVAGFSCLTCHIPQLFPCSDSSGTDRGSCGCHSNAYRLQNLADLFEFSAGRFCLFACLFDFVTEFVRFFLRLAELVADTIESLIVLRQFALHLIQCGFRVIQLNLPSLCTLIVFTKRRSRIFQRGFQGRYFFFLIVDLLVKSRVSRRERFNRIVVFVELRLYELHFAAQHFEGLVDFGKGLFEFALTLDADFQAEAVRQLRSPP